MPKCDFNKVVRHSSNTVSSIFLGQILCGVKYQMLMLLRTKS